MKKSLQDKLKGYIALTGSLAATSAGAQVVYTDINPDTIVHDSLFYNLDFNGDLVTDFQFVTGVQVGSSTWIYCNVLPQGAATNAVEASIIGQYAYPLALNTGDTIKASNPNWISYAQHSAMYLASMIGTNLYGNFRGQNDKYMAARFDISGVTHYGWVRMSINLACDSITIKDYAYEAQADSEIVINDPTGIQQHTNSPAIRVHAYENTVFVHTTEPQNGGAISIYNMTGQLIREEEITSGEMTINLSNETTGMYVVHVRQGNLVTTRKIYLR
jgi:hypothetical protein